MSTTKFIFQQKRPRVFHRSHQPKEITMFTGLNTPDIHYIAKYNKSVNWNFERFFLLRESLRPFGRLRDLAVVLLRQRRVKRTNSFVHFRADKQAAVGCTNAQGESRGGARTPMTEPSICCAAGTESLLRELKSLTNG